MSHHTAHSRRPVLRLLAGLLLTAGSAACGASLTTDLPPDAQDPAAEAEAGTDPDTSQLPEGHLEVSPDEVDTLFHSSTSGVDDVRRAVIRTDSEWISAWSELTGNVAPAPPVPEVDFASHVVLVATMGEKPSGGYHVDVDRLSYAADSLRVVVRATSPGASCVTTMALTHPATAVKVPLVAENVVFVEESAVTNCS